MKRVISLVLALMLVLSLACTAFAATSSIDCSGKHNFNGDSTCDDCGFTCGTHEYVNGACTVCGKEQPTNIIYNLIVDGNPKTGDIIMTWVAVMGMAAAALFVVTKSYRKAR